MKTKRLMVILLAIGLILTAVQTYAAPTKLKSMGRYTFARVKGNIPTPEVMKMLADRYAVDIKMGFDMAGYSDLYLPFLDQLKTGTYTDTTLAVGDSVMWMLFRSRGKVKVTKEVVWDGKAPLEVFAIDVTKDFKIYHFIIPKPCGNIALKGITDAPAPLAVCSLVVTPEKCNLNDPITVDMGGTKNAKSMTVEVFNAKGERVATQNLTPDSPKWQTKFDAAGEYTFKSSAVNIQDVVSANACTAKTYINFPPVCKLWTSCLPCEDYVGRPIFFDASQSTDPDGEIVKAVFEFADSTGKVLDTITVAEKPLKCEKIFAKAGFYAVAVTVFDNAGAVSSASDACRLAFEVTQKRFFWLLAAGPMVARGTYTAYGFVQGGIFYWLSPNRFSLTASAGGAVPFQGDPWKFMFLANVLANVHAGPVYFGAGLGYSTKEQPTRKSGLDGVGQIGVDVFNKWTSMGSIYFEFRTPLASSRSFDKHHKFALGFRYIF
jgi:hypothetical protein